mmetsp:Transcript_6866/g.9463  ORF Transcript_6866/g.9463 Transcript_6866/m.9463 type:complete len:93 (-) Transcript_6866:1077-1355(-)
MVKFRKNLEVQKFLKDQMAHVENQRAINRVKKQEEFSDVKNKTKEFQQQLKQSTAAKRNMISSTQMHNKMEMTAREDTFRNTVDHDRVQSQI